MVALPLALDQRGARRGERFGQTPGGDLGAHRLHAQRLALIGDRRQRGDAGRDLAREPRVIGGQRLALTIERGAAFGAKR